MKIIQICGTNGTGKTTLVKNLLCSGKFMKMSVQVYGRSKEWWFDGNTGVIGKYNKSNCCGVDTEKYAGDELKRVIEQIINDYRPKTVLFEDIRYGSSFSFKKLVSDIAKGNGYEYCVFALAASFECTSKRVLERSGNLNADYDKIRGKARQVIMSNRRLQSEGTCVVWCDTEKEDQSKVLMKLRKVING